MGKRGRLGKYKESSSKVWGENEYKSEITKEVECKGIKRLYCYKTRVWTDFR